MSTYQRSINQILSNNALVTSINGDLNLPLNSSNEISMLSENSVRFTRITFLDNNIITSTTATINGFNFDTVMVKIENIRNKNNKRYLLKNE